MITGLLFGMSIGTFVVCCFMYKSLSNEIDDLRSGSGIVMDYIGAQDMLLKEMIDSTRERLNHVEHNLNIGTKRESD